jgi:hypothetical protein
MDSMTFPPSCSTSCGAIRLPFRLLLERPAPSSVGIVVTDRFELFFDTWTPRGSAEPSSDPKIAFVIGGLTSGDERTVQYEGLPMNPAAPISRT